MFFHVVVVAVVVVADVADVVVVRAKHYAFRCQSTSSVIFSILVIRNVIKYVCVVILVGFWG